MKKITPVAIAVIYDKTKNVFLLTKRRAIDGEDEEFGPCWNFPGGGIEFGEDPITALKREIVEELRVEIQVEHLLPQIFSPVRRNWHGLLICYLCALKVPSDTIVLNYEATHYGWFTYEEVQKLHKLPLVSEMLDEAIKLLKKG